MKSLTTILNGASLAGLASFTVILLAFYSAESNPLGPLKFLLLVSSTAFYVMYLLRFRNKDNGGYITYGETLAPGLIFAFLYSSLVAMLCFFFMSYADQSMFDLIKTEQLKALGMTKDIVISYLGKDAYETMLLELEGKGAGYYCLSDFFSKFITVAIINLIIGGILRKSNPTSEFIDGQS